MEPCERERIARLVVAAQRGDAGAFAALTRRYRPTATLIARQACGHGETAEDAVQDAFVTAFRALSKLEDPKLFGPWLATIVRNRAHRLGKERRRREALSLAAIEPGLLRAPTVSLPSPEVQALGALPPGIRESMQLYYLQEWSVGEIAGLLERPVTTVKWQLHAGRALLRKRLGDSENPQ